MYLRTQSFNISSCSCWECPTVWNAIPKEIEGERDTVEDCSFKEDLEAAVSVCQW